MTYNRWSKTLTATIAPETLLDGIDQPLSIGEDSLTLLWGETVLATFSVLPGDVNGDGTVDAIDVSIAAIVANGADDYNIRADVDGNGIVDWKDVEIISTLQTSPAPRS